MKELLEWKALFRRASGFFKQVPTARKLFGQIQQEIDRSLANPWSHSSKKATPKLALRVMGVKGLTLYHLKSHLQKYRLGQQAKKHNTIEQNTKNNVKFVLETGHIIANERSILNRELPIAEALRCQVEVQKRLQKQLEVQKKLQMRIEAQGKYLQTILEKAQKSLTLDMNFPAVMDGEVRNENNIHKSLLNDINRKANGSLYLGEVEERKDIELKVEGGSVNFDLNTRGSYDFIGTSRSEMEAKTLAYRIYGNNHHASIIAATIIAFQISEQAQKKKIRRQEEEEEEEEEEELEGLTKSGGGGGGGRDRGCEAEAEATAGLRQLATRRRRATIGWR
ncbi:hypothetical protein HYC85_017189 [Camellia sinensis]|uniref:MYB-CC type transcription factor LHEQLE-containing domain-containing protein n=1 Tax=Camellia sinensis TaxID=4442 RepID=A0A7J7H3Z6_CAMSI|nr:hypothetical protein HYC85_017189 [Camellia sinensis]